MQSLPSPPHKRRRTAATTSAAAECVRCVDLNAALAAANREINAIRAQNAELQAQNAELQAKLTAASSTLVAPPQAAAASSINNEQAFVFYSPQNSGIYEVFFFALSFYFAKQTTLDVFASKRRQKCTTKYCFYHLILGKIAAFKTSFLIAPYFIFLNF